MFQTQCFEVSYRFFNVIFNAHSAHFECYTIIYMKCMCTVYSTLRKIAKEYFDILHRNRIIRRMERFSKRNVERKPFNWPY